MVWPKCCVPNCGEKSYRRVRFPHPISDSNGRFDVWVKRVGDPKLLCMDPKTIYNNKRICLKHFSDSCFIAGTSTLRKDSLPTLFLRATEQMEARSLPGPSQDSTMAPVASTPPAAEQMEVGSQPGPSSDGLVTPVASTPPAAEQMEVGSQPGPSSDGLVTPVASTPPAAEQMEVGSQPGPSGLQTPRGHRNAIRENPMRGQNKEGVLRQLGVRRAIELTPKARCLYKANKLLRRGASRSSKKLVSFKRRLKAADSLSGFSIGALDNLPPALSSFLHCQLAEYHKKGKGHRFPLDYKVWSLSLLKRSGRTYDYLSKLFVLPSRRTLLRLLSRLSFSTGINNAMFDHLSFTVKKKVKVIDRHCILMFDEMSLTPHLEFQEHLDFIEGFEDLGGGHRSQRFADRALVFMVRGLRRKFKQPVAYVFPAGSIKTLDLSKLIKAVIIKLLDSGLKINATVCDQGSTNVAAINKLCAETRESVLRCGGEYRGDYFCVNDTQVFPLFDPPHMLKGVRNCLITKDLKFCLDGVNKIASWRHILQVYAIDCRQQRLMPKLTDYHVVPEKIKKMKVKFCTQVFSQRLSAIMLLLSERPSGGDIEPEAADTAYLLGFFDQLFDSVNGGSKKPLPEKPLLCAVTSSSGHMEFWSKAIKLLQSMTYTDGRKDSKTPSITNWGRTLRNIQTLWLLLKGQGFKSLCLRNLNQDPLENKFGCIRSYGHRNISPTVANFVGAYKSLILNDMVAAHSVGANCEEDDCEVLDNLKSYLGVSVLSSSSSSSPPVDIDDGGEGGLENVDDQPGGTRASSSVGSTMKFADLSAGDLLKKLGPVQCENCAMKRCASERVPNFPGFMQPTEEFAGVYALATGLIHRHLPHMAHKLGVGSFLRSLLSQMIDFRFIACDIHHVSYGAHFCKYVVRATVTTWCNSVNRYLSGKYTKRTEVMDIIHLLAQQSFAKRKRRP